MVLNARVVAPAAASTTSMPPNKTLGDNHAIGIALELAEQAYEAHGLPMNPA